MNKTIIGVILLVVILGGLFLFNQQNLTGAFTLQPEDKLIVGASLALSGKTASYGNDMKNGIELAIKNIKESGEPLNFDILYDDTTSSVEKAVTSSQKFIEMDKAKVIIGVGADDVLAIAPVTEQKKIILVTPIAGSDAIDDAGEYIFRNREPSSSTAFTLAEFLILKEKNESAIIVANTASSISYANAFREKYTSLGGNIPISINYNETTLDLRTEIIKIKEAKINSIYLIASKDKDGSEIVKQLKEANYEGLIVGGPALNTTSFFQSTKEAAEGIIIAEAPVDANAPNATQILNEYKSTYGKEMSFGAANSYDLTMILNNAARKCNADTNCIRDYFLSVKDYPGLGGKTTFNSKGGVTKPMSLKIAKEGKFVLYGIN